MVRERERQRDNEKGRNQNGHVFVSKEKRTYFFLQHDRNRRQNRLRNDKIFGYPKGKREKREIQVLDVGESEGADSGNTLREVRRRGVCQLLERIPAEKTRRISFTLTRLKGRA